MDLPGGYRLRPPKPDDLTPVAAVLIADQHSDGMEPVLDAHFIREVWSRTGFDLATDAWVVTNRSGTIVGYAQVRQEEPEVVGSWGVVHPKHRGRGVGSALLDQIEERAANLMAGVSSSRFQHSISAADRAAASMLEGRGLRPVRHFWHMQIDLAGAVEPWPAPAGVEISGIDASHDLQEIHAVLDEAFLGDPGDHPRPFDEWAEEQVRSPSYDPTLWLLARDGASPVGTVIASAADDAGWVDWLGVVPSHRSRGIGAVLLRRSFATFGSRELQRVRLNVDAENPTGATAVYEHVGMRVVNRWDLWER